MLYTRGAPLPARGRPHSIEWYALPPPQTNASPSPAPTAGHGHHRTVVAALLCLALALWPMRDALRAGALPGAGPDVVSTTWGMWWFTQVGPLDSVGSWTDLVNHPAGADGALLAPSATVVWALTQPLLGPGLAGVLAVLSQLLGLAAATAWLARTTGASAQGATVAALVVLAGRYPLHAVGEASVVAIAALPLVLGLGCLVLLDPDRPAGRLPLLGLLLCLPWLAAENPYLLPVLLLAAGLVLVRAVAVGDRRRALHLGLVILGGTVAVGHFALVFASSAAPDYPPHYPVEVVGPPVTLGPLAVPIADTPWARASLTDLLWPGPVAWTEHAMGARGMPGGGRYLGLAGVVLALVALVTRARRTLPWVGLALLGATLAMGSRLGPAAGPFLWLNGLMDVVARPLTQPTRFLVVAMVGLAVAAAWGADALRSRWGAAALFSSVLVVIGEAVAVGGTSLRLPTTPLPTLSCADQLPAGAVLTWPDEASDRWAGHAQLLQLSHGRASSHRGIASWRQEQPLAQQSLALVNFQVDARLPLVADALMLDGYRLVVASPSADERDHAWLRETLGEAVAACDGHTVYDLANATGNEHPPPHR